MICYFIWGSCYKYCRFFLTVFFSDSVTCHCDLLDVVVWMCETLTSVFCGLNMLDVLCLFVKFHGHLEFAVKN